MNRRDMIIISVLINAGLLVVLFVCAMVSREDPVDLPSSEVAQALAAKPATVMPGGMEEKISLSVPAVAESTVMKSEGMEAKAAETALPVAEIPNKLSEEFLHKLPSLEPEPIATLASPVVEKPSPLVKEIRVKKGDSLAKIARTYSTTVAKLRELNPVCGKFLKINQKLMVPVEGSSVRGSMEKSLDTSAVASVELGEYVVRKGDSPWTIAAKHHMKVEDLLRINGLDQTKAKSLKPGDKLKVHP